MVKYCSYKLGTKRKVCTTSPHLDVLHVMQIRHARAILLIDNTSVQMELIMWISVVLFNMQTKPCLFSHPNLFDCCS